MEIQFNNLSVGNIGNENIDFILEDGDRLAIIGKNGIGKTTLLNRILGLRTDKNHIEKSIKKSCIFQENLLDDELTISDNLKVRSTSNEEYNLAISLLKIFEIFEYRKKYGILSGGEKRIVNFVRSVMTKPELLIMDELSSGIDTSKLKKIWDIIDRELPSNKKIIFTTHHLEELTYANKILFIKEKKAKLFLNTDEFFSELPRYKLIIAEEYNDKKILFFNHFKEAFSFAVNKKIDLDKIEISKSTFDDLFGIYLEKGE